MRYVPRRLAGGSLPELVLDIEQEHREIELALLAPEVDFLRLRKIYAAPEKLFDGMIVYADGTNWNPDGTSGRGMYRYDEISAAWVFLG